MVAQLPERQRVYYQAWHRNGRLGSSTGGTSMNAGRPGGSDSLFGDEESRETEEANVDPVMKTPTNHALPTNSPVNGPANGSPRPSTSSTTSKTPSQKTQAKQAVAPSPVPSSGNATIHPASAMPPPTYFAPPAPAPMRYFSAQSIPPATVSHFYPTVPPAVGVLPAASLSSASPSSNAATGNDTLRRANPYSETETPSPKKRRVRHCAKCGSPTCKGRGGGSNCPNPCRDCGKVECKGRSSTKPGRVCETAAATSSVTD